MYDAIVVGGGIAGLTASAYLSQSGYKTLLLEKESKCGGLISSFEREGFTFDNGIRAIENSGILFPMIRQLGLDLELLKNPISLGIEDKVVWINSVEDIKKYQSLLSSIYPQNCNEVQEIIDEIKKIMKYMEVLYGIENPAFRDLSKDMNFLFTKILPWAFKYIFTVPKINKLNIPVVPFLEKYTQNRALIDIIAQHFFKDTPTYFALSYLKIYLDYYYPKGGTGMLPQKLISYIEKNGGTIHTDTRVTSINPIKKYLMDSKDNKYDYRQMIWAADQNSLYSMIHPDIFQEDDIKQAVAKKQASLIGKLGNDSIFALNIAVNIEPKYFTAKNSGHFFYTPSRQGLTSCGEAPLNSEKKVIIDWLRNFSSLTTYEISIPVLRDPSLAPSGKTGLMISTLFDYHLTKKIFDQGWYNEFRYLFEDMIIDVLNKTIYPGIVNSIIYRFSSTPISFENRTANTHGAITGWAFTNNPMPAENRLVSINNSTETPIPDVIQAGQWTYSPSGLPISILTGKLAADRVLTNLKKEIKS
jgi:phytoene dehydrogenase-like protein